MDLEKKIQKCERKYDRLMSQFLAAETYNEKNEIVKQFSILGYRNKFGKAIYFVGLCCETGNGIPKSSGYTPYSNAIKYGYLPAYFNRAEGWQRSAYEILAAPDKYFDEEDARDEIEFAIADYTKLAEKNDAASQFRLAQLYSSWPYYDLEKAEFFYKLAIVQDYQPAKEALEWLQKNADLFNNTKDGKKAILKKHSREKVGQKIMNEKGLEVTILYQCSCYPGVFCFLADDGRHYKDHFNCKSCADSNKCMAIDDDSMELDIRDIKVRADAAFQTSNWRFV